MSVRHQKALTLSLDLTRVEGDQRMALSGMCCLTKLKRGPKQALTVLEKMRDGEPSTLLGLWPNTLVTIASVKATSDGLQAQQAIHRHQHELFQWYA